MPGIAFGLQSRPRLFWDSCGASGFFAPPSGALGVPDGARLVSGPCTSVPLLGPASSFLRFVISDSLCVVLLPLQRCRLALRLCFAVGLGLCSWRSLWCR